MFTCACGRELLRERYCDPAASKIVCGRYKVGGLDSVACSNAMFFDEQANRERSVADYFSERYPELPFRPDLPCALVGKKSDPASVRLAGIKSSPLPSLIASSIILQLTPNCAPRHPSSSYTKHYLPTSLPSGHHSSRCCPSSPRRLRSRSSFLRSRPASCPSTRARVRSRKR